MGKMFAHPLEKARVKKHRLPEHKAKATFSFSSFPIWRLGTKARGTTRGGGSEHKKRQRKLRWRFWKSERNF